MEGFASRPAAAWRLPDEDACAARDSSPLHPIVGPAFRMHELGSVRSATEVPAQAGTHSRNSAACPCVAPSTTTIHTTAPEMRKRVPSFAIRTPW